MKLLFYLIINEPCTAVESGQRSFLNIIIKKLY